MLLAAAAARLLATTLAAAKLAAAALFVHYLCLGSSSAVAAMSLLSSAAAWWPGMLESMAGMAKLQSPSVHQHSIAGQNAAGSLVIPEASEASAQPAAATTYTPRSCMGDNMQNWSWLPATI